MADAVFNVAHGALLALGLAQGDLDLIARGLADRLHQDRRAHLYPRSMELVKRARALGAVGATISGAGPTVLVWTHWEQTGAVFGAPRERAGGLGDGAACARSRPSGRGRARAVGRAARYATTARSFLRQRRGSSSPRRPSSSSASSR